MEREQVRRWICLGAVAILHATNNLAFRLTDDLRPFSGQELIATVLPAVMFSQSVLLALWVALGNAHILIRLPRSLLILTLLCFAPDYLIPRRGTDFFNIESAIRTGLWEAEVGFFMVAWAVFGPLRRIARWRAVEASQALTDTRRVKFTIRDLLVLTALTGMVLATSRGMVNYEILADRDFVLDMIPFGLTACGASLLAPPVVWLALTFDRRNGVRLAAVSSVIAGCALLWAFERYFGEPHNWAAVRESSLTSLGYFASIFVTLRLVRLAGVRLVRIH